MNGFVTLSLGYLANALWQVPLVWGGAKLLLSGARHHSAAVQHRIWVGALLLQAVLPAASLLPAPKAGSVATAAWLAVARWINLSGWFAGHHPGSHGGAQVVVSFGEGVVASGWAAPPYLLEVIASLYVTTCVLFGLRLLWGYWQTRALRGGARPLATGTELRRWTDQVADQLGVHGVRTGVSPAVEGPVTVGVRPRWLLLPPDFAYDSEEDARAALAHECAHMQRHDFAKNLLYRGLSLPVAFHPCLRATLAGVAESREMVCDAMAAEAVAGAKRYAKSILRLASRLRDGGSGKPHYAIGIFDANTLERRITMLTRGQKGAKGGQRIRLGIAGAVLCLGACTSAMAFRLHLAPAQVGGQGQEPMRVSGAVMAEYALTKVPPEYPEEARAKHLTGSVVLSAVIDDEGVIRELTVVSGPAQLAGAALEAVRQWTYTPFALNGVRKTVQTTVTVNFQLNP